MSIRFETHQCRFVAFYLREILENFLSLSSRSDAGTRFRTKSRKSSAAELSAAEPLPGFTSGIHEMEHGFAAPHDIHLQESPPQSGVSETQFFCCWKLHLLRKRLETILQRCIAKFIHLPLYLLVTTLLAKIRILSRCI